MLQIKILTGSSRPGRFNIQPASWITKVAQLRKDAEIELLDLAEIKLPFLDEPAPPSRRQYTQEHTKLWSAKIDAADGFVFVTPEYNHSFSPILKNALDFLYAEWNYKPVAFISYGSLAGGSRAVEQLRGVAGDLKLFDLREQIMLPNYWENLDEKGEFKFNELHIKSASTMLDALFFWSAKMKAAREELARQ